MHSFQVVRVRELVAIVEVTVSPSIDTSSGMIVVRDWKFAVQIRGGYRSDDLGNGVMRTVYME